MSKEMTKDYGLGNVVAVYAEEAETGAVDGDWIEFPVNSKLSVSVFSTGTCKVQTTNAKLSDVRAATVPANSIIDWDNGAVVSGQAVIEVCSAYRLVSISGDSEMYGYATRLG